MSSATTTKHRCARCGRKATADRMVYSRFTGSRYCRRCTAKAGRA